MGRMDGEWGRVEAGKHGSSHKLMSRTYGWVGCFLLIGDLGEGFEEGILSQVKAKEARTKENAAFQVFSSWVKGKLVFPFSASETKERWAFINLYFPNHLHGGLNNYNKPSAVPSENNMSNDNVKFGTNRSGWASQILSWGWQCQQFQVWSPAASERQDHRKERGRKSLPGCISLSKGARLPLGWAGQCRPNQSEHD